MYKAGVIGVGHLGNFHANKYFEHSKTNLLGVYDIDNDKAKNIANKYSCLCFDSIDELLDNVDIVTIATPATKHYESCVNAIAKGVHVLVEKPFTHDLLEAKKIINLSKEKNIYIQVGFLEKFNIAFTNAIKHVSKPLFAECHRLSSFTGRSIDIDVIKDIMIHDIELVLNIFGPEIENIDAVGSPILTDQPDIAQAKLEFTKGRIVNLTASRVSNKLERKMRLFQKHKYIGIDFQNTSYEVFGKVNNEIQGDKKEFGKFDSLYEQLDYFINVLEAKSEKLNIDLAYKSIEISDEISKKISDRLNIL